MSDQASAPEVLGQGDAGVGRVPPRHTCVQDGQIICPDDLCRGSSRTLCGLEEGIDFGYESDEDDEPWCGECGCVSYECHCDDPVLS